MIALFVWTVDGVITVIALGVLAIAAIFCGFAWCYFKIKDWMSK